MRFLEKIQNLSLKTRKIILWAALAVLAALLLTWWIKSIPERVRDFQLGQLIGEINLPKMEIPQFTEIPNLENINASEEIQTPEN